MNEPQSGRRRGIVLTASLLFNVFLLAIIGGHVLRHHGERGFSPMSTSLARALANAEASLPPSDAAKFRDVMTRGAPLYAQSAKQLAEARAALQRQIVAEPFDRQAVRSAFLAWQQSWNRLLDNAGDTLIEALAQVSPEGRRKLIAQRQAALKRDSTP
ncbi:MAG TPA: periplasmic heavy metal sensor [Steroidobacteraceae bacterium]|nr:periplasmic heavy metal sensor [Steroidobacteraceae bacterium]